MRCANRRRASSLRPLPLAARADNNPARRRLPLPNQLAPQPAAMGSPEGPRNRGLLRRACWTRQDHGLDTNPQRWARPKGPAIADYSGEPAGLARTTDSIPTRSDGLARRAPQSRTTQASLLDSPGPRTRYQPAAMGSPEGPRNRGLLRRACWTRQDHGLDTNPQRWARPKGPAIADYSGEPSFDFFDRLQAIRADRVDRQARNTGLAVGLDPLADPALVADHGGRAQEIVGHQGLG